MGQSYYLTMFCLPKLSQFINELTFNPLPASIAEYRGSILRNITEANLSSIRVSISLDDIQIISEDTPASQNALLPLTMIMQVLYNYVKWRNVVESGVANRERTEILNTILLSVSKLGKFAVNQRRKFETEIKELIGADASLNPEAITEIWEYIHTYISETLAPDFFITLKLLIPEDELVHFHYLFIYTAHQNMAGMKFISSAMSKFPDFPWFQAQAEFHADWNKFVTLFPIMWNRPYMAYTKIGPEYGLQNYKSLAFLAWRLICTKGSSRDVYAKHYKGFGNMPTDVVVKVTNHVTLKNDETFLIM